VPEEYRPREIRKGGKVFKSDEVSREKVGKRGLWGSTFDLEKKKMSLGRDKRKKKDIAERGVKGFPGVRTSGNERGKQIERGDERM